MVVERGSRSFLGGKLKQAKTLGIHSRRYVSILKNFSLQIRLSSIFKSSLNACGSRDPGWGGTSQQAALEGSLRVK